MGLNLAQKAAELSLADYRVIHVFGKNDALGSALEDVWVPGGSYPWPSKIQLGKVKVASDSGDDHINGDGARTIELVGLDPDLNEINETLEMNGTTQVESRQIFCRINRMAVGNVGLLASSNIGDIILRSVTTNNILGRITKITNAFGSGNHFGLGIAQQTHQTIPFGHVGFLYGITINTEGNKAIDLYLFKRERIDLGQAPYSGVRMVLEFKGIEGTQQLNFEEPIRFAEKTDIWFAAISTPGLAAIDVDYDYLLKRDTKADPVFAQIQR
jgi:hypothetical protein